MTKSKTINEAIEGAKELAYLPDGYFIEESNNTLCRKKKDGDTLICDPLYIKALTRDPNGENWGRLLMWHDKDGQKHEWAMPSEMLAGDGAEYRRILLDRGLCIRSGRTAQNSLHDYILSATPPTRALSVTMSGWHGESYVSVDSAVYGNLGNRILLQVRGTSPKIEKAGSLEGWQDYVAKYAIGNSRLAFALSASFAGALLHPSGESSGGIHFVGASSTGKTTTLRLAVSAWGCPMRNWRTTDNAAESWARFANDSLLALDDLGQVDGRAADQMAYMLGNGQTKGRSNRNGIARDTDSFRLIFLSTGEIGLADKVAEAGKNIKAGQAVRMLDIPADAGAGLGVFESLHGFEGGAELSSYLAEVTQTHKGYAIPAFLEKIAAMDFKGLQDSIMRHKEAWLNAYLPVGADGQVLRADLSLCINSCSRRNSGKF